MDFNTVWIYKIKQMVQNHNNKITDEQIKECYDKGITLHQASAELNLTTVTLWRRAKKLDLQWKDIPRTNFKRVPLEEILNGNYPEYQTFKLKNRLLAEGIKQNICEVCEINEWNGNPINMQLDHIDGNSHNHQLDNLRMICPNCHSQTDTYCGKNK
jgi:hypothetical protein